MKKRTARFARKTKETSIEISLNLDGQGNSKIKTGIPFMDHMLGSLAKHGLYDINIKAKGDLKVDPHHLVEDLGISLGKVFKDALGSKARIGRFGYSLVPMDEALADVAVDISGRSRLVFSGMIPKKMIGNFDPNLTKEFFDGFVDSAGITLHIRLRYSDNSHHAVEAIFKAFAVALSKASSIDPRKKGIPSTKGSL